MKRTFVIVLSAVFLASGLQVSFDKHFCGGILSATKISFNGAKASCGMEESDSRCSNQPSYDSKCCSDQMTTFSINNNYLPEYFQLSKPFPIKPVLLFEHILLPGNLSSIATYTKCDSPPGINLLKRLTQPDICVFRI